MFGKALSIEIKYAGLSRAQFARLMGVAPKTVYMWLNGESIPYKYNLERMAEVLNCSLDHLFGYF